MRRAAFDAPRTVPASSVALAVAGFAAIGLSWRGAAALLTVPLQMPYVVSGGAAGLALIVFGVGSAYVHTARVAAAAEEAAIDDLHRRLARVGAALAKPKPDRRQVASAERRERRALRAARRAARPND